MVDFMLLRWCCRTTLWWLFPVLLGAQETAPEAGKCVFAGVVQDSVSGLPLARATVKVFSRSTGGPGYAATTGAEGAFRFEAIGAGDYTIQVSAPGYGQAWAVALKPGQATAWLHFSGGEQVTGAVAALDPPAVVSGHVTDAEGEPVAQGPVGALARQWHRGTAYLGPAGGTETDGRGAYRLVLQAGRYFLTAGPRVGDSLPEVFSDGPGEPEKIVAPVVYRNLPDTNGATEFDLHPGEQLAGIDFKLPTVPAYHVRGTVRGAADFLNGSYLLLEPRDGRRLRTSETALKNGAFDFAGVPPGEYVVQTTGRSSEYAASNMPVRVTDRDLNGIVLQVRPPLSLSGHVSLEGGGAQDWPRVQLRLTLLEYRLVGQAVEMANAKPDGSFHVGGLSTGRYAVDLVAPGNLYVESISYNQREAPGGILDLSNGAAGELDVVLASGTGQIGGTIRWPDAVPGAAAAVPGNIMAVLAPADGVTGNTGARIIGVDQTGGFQFRNLGPGRYYVWAVTHFSDQWQNMDFVTEMEDRGVAVDLPEKGSAQVEITEVME